MLPYDLSNISKELQPDSYGRANNYDWLIADNEHISLAF